MEKKTKSGWWMLFEVTRVSEERFKKQEKERWRKETELEEKQRKEDKEHGMHLMGMLASKLRPQPPYLGPVQMMKTFLITHNTNH